MHITSSHANHFHILIDLSLKAFSRQLWDSIFGFSRLFRVFQGTYYFDIAFQSIFLWEYVVVPKRTEFCVSEALIFNLILLFFAWLHLSDIQAVLNWCHWGGHLLLHCLQDQLQVHFPQKIFLDHKDPLLSQLFLLLCLVS